MTSILIFGLSLIAALLFVRWAFLTFSLSEYVKTSGFTKAELEEMQKAQESEEEAQP